MRTLFLVTAVIEVGTGLALVAALLAYLRANGFKTFIVSGGMP